MKSIIIKTQNRELYNKLNSLNFVKEITIDKDNAQRINQILSSINKSEHIVSKEIIGNKIKLRKEKLVNFNVYFNLK